MAEFWFIRHFRTPWNAEDRLQGQRDIALDDQDMATLAVNRLTLGETFADFTARIMRIRQRVLAAPGSVLAFGHGAWLGGLRLVLEPPARIPVFARRSRGAPCAESRCPPLARGQWRVRRFGPPCPRAFRLPSASTLMPVLSISGCSGPMELRQGMLTARIFDGSSAC